jgi:hypothetical protein
LQEAVSIDKVVQNKDGEYAVIIDRISRCSLLSCVSKNAALTGTNVINNPFWWSADDDKFFNNSLADTLEYHYPIRFYCHPAEHPTDTTGKVIQKLKIPNGLGRDI